MLVAAALVPETPLLVPGAAGSAEVLVEVRAAALAAVGALLAAAPDQVVVVVPSRAPRAAPRTGRLVPTLAAAGIPDRALAWPPVPLPVAPLADAPTGAAEAGAAAADVPPAHVPAADDPAGAGPHVVHDVGASVALLLLSRCGWAGPVRVTAADEAAAAADVADPADPAARVAVLLVGSLSARRGPDAPLPEDPRAAAVDDAVAADLLDLGASARRRLLDLPADLAAELAVSARGPWRYLLAASSDVALRGRAHAVTAPHGATLAVLSWRPA